MYKSIKTYVSAAIASMVAVASSASAALSTEVGTALTQLQTDGLALVDLLWPVVGSLTIAFLIIKLFKRGMNKV